MSKPEVRTRWTELLEEVCMGPQFSAKLGRLLRNFLALQFVVAKIAGLIRRHQVKTKQPGASGARAFKDFKSDRPFANAIGGIDVSQSEREKLIRRRWLETGIRMWNPEVYGPALNIQGHEGVLPIKQGQALPSYDELKFKLVGSRIVCEGVVVDPPSRHDNANSLEARQCRGRFRN